MNMALPNSWPTITELSMASWISVHDDIHTNGSDLSSAAVTLREPGMGNAQAAVGRLAACHVDIEAWMNHGRPDGSN